jgi:hypothetical protein
MYEDELSPHISPARTLREIQLGQRLYRSGELLKAPDLHTLQMAAYAKWTDPVISCMSYYAWEKRLETGSRSERHSAKRQMNIMARNLKHYFGDLADSRVIFGQFYEKQRQEIYQDLLAKDQVPILAESARRLASFALENGWPQAGVVRLARRIPAGEIWTLNVA